MEIILAELRLRAETAAQLDRALSDFANTLDIVGRLSDCAAADRAQTALRRLDAAVLLALPSAQAAQLLSELTTASAKLSAVVEKLLALD